MNIKNIIKTLLIFIDVFLFVALIYLITNNILVTIFNGVFSSIEDDNLRMQTSARAAFPIYIIFFNVVFFIFKYRLIVDKLAEMKQFEGVKPTSEEIRRSCLQSKQNLTELIAYAIFITVIMMLIYAAYNILFALILSVLFIALFAAACYIIDICVKTKWINNRMHI